MLRRHADLAGAAIATLAALAASMAAPPVLRTIATVGLLIVLPGFALLQVLLPGRPVDRAARLTLMLALGLATPILIGIGLGFSGTGLGFRRETVALSLTLTVLVALLVAYRRRRASDDPAAARAEPAAPDTPMASPMRAAGPTKVGGWRADPPSLALLAAGLLLAVGALNVAGGSAAPPDDLVQLWILPGTAGGATVGIYNGSPDAGRYRLEITAGGASIPVGGELVTVAAGATWEMPLLAEATDGLRGGWTATLYRIDAPAVPFRTVWLPPSDASPNP